MNLKNYKGDIILNLKKQMKIWWSNYRNQNIAELKAQRIESITSAMFFLSRCNGYNLTIFPTYILLEHEKDKFKFTLDKECWKCFCKNKFEVRNLMGGKQ